jgi:ABC-type antimicrobial peptide transport system permease subunit
MANFSKINKNGNFGLELVGDKKLARELGILAGKSLKKIMKPAINAGLNPIKKRAEQLAKGNFKSKTIAKQVKKSAKVSKDKTGIVGQVFIKHQPERTIKIEGREAPFEVVANILEFGSAEMNIPARSYMRRGREEKRAEAIRTTTAKAKERLRIEAGKGGLKLK